MRHDPFSVPAGPRRWAVVSTVVLVALLLAIAAAACGGTDTEASPAPTVTATVTASPAASPATTATSGAEPSATVMALQSDLKIAGYYKGELTGVYDDATKAAVKRMEAALHVKGADTQYGADTYAAQKSTGRQNMTATFVKQVQVAMQQLGYYKGSIDGVYGANTVAAVKAFQSSVGLTADGIAGPRTIAAYEAKLKGDSTVSTLQQELTNWGYYSGAIDGVYGPATVEAVKKLQTDLGVTPVDGRWGPKTQAAAQAAHGGGKGKYSAATAQIQSDLTTLGYYRGSIDGLYGPATTAAVKAFQKAYGLPVDGIVGPDTMTAIEMAMKARSGG